MYVWEVMNMHAAPLKREAALAALKRIPALTPDSIWKTPLNKLESAVGLAGPYADERIRALRAGADLFRRNPDLPRRITGPLLTARRALARIPRIGAAGSARMLLFVTGYPVIPVDATLARVALRLGYGTANASIRRQVHSIKCALSAAIPLELEPRRRIVAILEHHGQSTCAEFDPHCHVCPLVDHCQFGRERLAG
jgi:endonuclease-3